ncbi:MAG: hypothetical protein ACKVIH_05870 [Burkholderiales bacterium]
MTFGVTHIAGETLQQPTALVGKRLFGGLYNLQGRHISQANSAHRHRLRDAPWALLPAYKQK